LFQEPFPLKQVWHHFQVTPSTVVVSLAPGLGGSIGFLERTFAAFVPELAEDVFFTSFGFFVLLFFELLLLLPLLLLLFNLVMVAFNFETSAVSAIISVFSLGAHRFKALIYDCIHYQARQGVPTWSKTWQDHHCDTLYKDQEQRSEIPRWDSHKSHDKHLKNVEK